MKQKLGKTNATSACQSKSDRSLFLVTKKQDVDAEYFEDTASDERESRILE